MYLVFEHFLRDHENHGLYWLRRGYLVLYLTDPFPPETLIIGMLLAPLLDLAVPTLEITRIRLHPSALTLPLAFGPTLGILTTLLDLPGPWIRSVKPATIGTPLLSALGCFHMLILTDEGMAELMDGLSRERKELNPLNVWQGMK